MSEKFAVGGGGGGLLDYRVTLSPYWVFPRPLRNLYDTCEGLGKVKVTAKETGDGRETGCDNNVSYAVLTIIE